MHLTPCQKINSEEKLNQILRALVGKTLLCQEDLFGDNFYFKRILV